MTDNRLGDRTEALLPGLVQADGGGTGHREQVSWWLTLGAALQSTDPEVRRVALLRIYSLAGVLVSLAIGVVVLIGRRLGFFDSTQQVLSALAFPVGFVLICSTFLVIARQRRSRLLVRLYVWLTFLIIVAGAAAFNGYRSATWILVLWPVVLASALLKPVTGLFASIGAFLVYVTVMVLQEAGLYTPPLPTAPDSFPFFALSFGWVVMIGVVALFNTISGRGLNGVLATLRETSARLEASRQELSQRVAQRTAELESRAEQFRAIAELSQVAASIEDLETLLTRAAALIADRLAFYHVGIFLLDAGGEWAVLRAASSEGGARMLARGHRLRVGQQGIVGYVAEMGLSRYAFRVGDDAVWFSNPDLPETRSEIALPLIVSERVIGVLDIQTGEVAAFSDDDVEILRVLADGIAIAIQNTQLLQETRETLARLERYQESDALEAWRQALSRRHLEVGYGYSGGAVDASASRPAQLRELVGRVPEISRTTTDDGRHLLLAPIQVAGRQLGVLSFEGRQAWSDEAVQLVEAVTGQLDLALTNARLLEETRLRASQEAARGEIVGRIRALTSTDAILRSAAEELGRALQVEHSRIQLVRFGDESPSAQGTTVA